MKKGLIAVAVALAIAVLAPLAIAAGCVTYTYESGQLTIMAPQATAYHVLAERPDSTYVLVACGGVGPSGLVELALPATGPNGNGLPQFRICLSSGDGHQWFAIPDDIDDEEGGWAWD